jgi:putative restriction endonuclease
MAAIVTAGGERFHVVDTKEKMTVADSFVMPSNKLGRGNGEAKFYVGNDGDDVRQFFGEPGFELDCFMLRDDLLQYLADTEPEYRYPEQPYRRLERLPQLWAERLEKVRHLPEVLHFTAREQAQIAGPRVYINSDSRYYSLIRELSLPNITYVAAIKVLGADRRFRFYLRLFVDYFGREEHPSVADEVENKIEAEPISATEKEQLSRARIGQGKYRQDLLDQCPFCPITMVSDDRLLIASHIKPWAKSDDREKLDPKNGFMFTPTYDFLFDRGFISFTDDKRMLVSPWLSKMTCSKLSLVDLRLYTQLPTEGREHYLEYHRSARFKGSN